MVSEKEFDEAIDALYHRVSKRWEVEKKQLLNGSCGYSIFGSRPYRNPPLMIIGINPGFGGTIKSGPDIDRSPTTASYLEDDHSPFKSALQGLFGFQGGERLLTDAVATNFNFFKSRDIDSAHELSWNKVDHDVSRRVKDFCRAELKTIIEAIAPRDILVIGFEAVEEYLESRYTRLYRAHKDFHRLVETGDFEGRFSIGLRHLTGARFAEFDKELMGLWLEQYFHAKIPKL